MQPRVVSSRFPYLPVTLRIRQFTQQFVALVDAGFDADIAVPGQFMGYGPPDEYGRLQVADGRRVRVPSFYGTTRLGAFAPFDVLVYVLGNEPLLGRGVVDRYRVTLDHGQQVIVEP